MEKNEHNRKNAKKEYNTDDNNIIGDNCNKGSCTCCNKKYPINVLNCRKQYKYLDNEPNVVAM